MSLMSFVACSLLHFKLSLLKISTDGYDKDD
jgi:hypothetical protein